MRANFRIFLITAQTISRIFRRTRCLYTVCTTGRTAVDITEISARFVVALFSTGIATLRAAICFRLFIASQTVSQIFRRANCLYTVFTTGRTAVEIAEISARFVVAYTVAAALCAAIGFRLFIARQAIPWTFRRACRLNTVFASFRTAIDIAEIRTCVAITRAVAPTALRTAISFRFFITAQTIPRINRRTRCPDCSVTACRTFIYIA